jgi:hypothetical protein
MKSRDNSVGIETRLWAGDQCSRFRFLVGAGKFSLHHCVQNSSGANPASYQTGTMGFFPWGKVAGA